jgi:DNA primase
MNLVNQGVIYKTLVGSAQDAKIVAQDEKWVYIRFSSRDIRLQFPEAFEKFLRLKDEKLQAEVETLIAEKREKEAQKKIDEREAKLRAIEEAKRKEEETAIATKRKDKPVDRHANENNLAFKCNFCNGGCS